MTNIVFTDPPPAFRRGSAHPWEEIAEALRARPNEWALVLRGIHSSYSSQINHGKLSAFKPAGTFEARSVGTAAKDENGKPTHDLYVRYIGTADDETESNDDA